MFWSELATLPFYADSFVTLTIEFDDIAIMADFVMVPGSCMTTPLTMGIDIFNRDDITYRQYLTRTGGGGDDVHVVSTSVRSRRLKHLLRATNFNALQP